MIKKIISSVLLASVLFSLGSCGKSDDKSVSTSVQSEVTKEVASESSVSTDENEEVETVLDNTKAYKILFIGNSYTYYNEMPEVIFKEISAAAGYDFTVKSITKGGWDLIRSGSVDDEVGALVDAELKETKYDFVVMQEQSTNPALDPGKFYDGARAVYQKIAENGATPILYETWGRKTGHSVLEDNGLTNETMTWKIAAAYEAIGAELGVDVANVGRAFYDVYTTNERLDIYADDLTHPSYTGSYLAAMTIFAEITGVDPTTINYKGERSGAAAKLLKEAARKAVFETPAVPEEYKTSSVGVSSK